MKYWLWLFAFSFSNLWAQEFGQNKVQLERSQWKVVKTQHFDLYFDQKGERLATWTAQHIEGIYGQLRQTLGHSLRQRVPVILHNDPNHFRGTNVIPEALPEAVGGFTEVFKNRIVLPFDGSYNSFHHVLQHEMVHAITFDLVGGWDGGGLTRMRRMSDLPLWFSEGLAEFGSVGWDLESEFFLLDAVSFGYLPSPAGEMPGFLAYKGGQSFLFYVESSFGPGTVQKIFHEVARSGDLDQAFQRITKVNLEDLGELWLRELRRLYWPELAQRKHAKQFARQLTKGSRDQSNFNLSPALSPDGKRILFGSDRKVWEGILLAELDSIRGLIQVEQFLKNASTPDHESLLLFQSGYTWSPDGQKVALVTQSYGREVLQIRNLKGKRLQSYTAPFGSMRNPSWSPDGQSILVTGLEKGWQDIWQLHLNTGKWQELTQGPAAEDHASLSRDNKYLLYQSNAGFVNRGPGQIRKEHFHIVLHNLQTQDTRRITPETLSASQPKFGPGDSSIAFIGDHSGVGNLYELRLGDSTTLWQWTNVLSHISAFDWSSDGKTLVFSLFEAGAWDLYQTQNPQRLRQDLSPHQSPFARWDRQSPLFEKPFIETLDSWLASDSLNKDRRDSSDKAEDYKDSLRLDSLDRLKRLEADTTRFREQNPFDSTQKLLSTSYSPEWHLDRAFVAAGGAYAGGQVVAGGQVYLNFSDLLGDQNLSTMIFGQGTSIKDIQAFARYGYLPHRSDWYLTGWYTPSYRSSWTIQDTNLQMYRGDRNADSVKIRNTLLVIETEQGFLDTATLATCVFYNDKDVAYSFPSSNGLCARRVTYSDQSYGISGQISHPLSRFWRLDAGLGVEQIRRQLVYEVYNPLLNSYELKEDGSIPEKRWARTRLDLSSVFDNSRWGSTGPMAGRRMRLDASLIQSLQDPETYGILSTDLRLYKYLGAGTSLVFRGNAGISTGLQGENPHRFYLGGDQMLNLNPSVDLDHFDGTFRSSYASDLALPLRAFPYYSQSGNRLLLTNTELRFPFIRAIYFGMPPFALGGINGVVFTDVGGTWSESSPSPWDDFAWSWGYGTRVNLGIFVLRWTRAWSEYFHKAGGHKTDHWSLGADF
jgi:Tol biopolymer transport system component